MVISVKAKVKLNKYNNTKVKISGSKNSSLPIIVSSVLLFLVFVLFLKIKSRKKI